MSKVRKAKEDDRSAIVTLLRAVEFYNPPIEISAFWVLENDNDILAILQLDEYDDFFYLSNVATKPSLQKEGIGSELVKGVAERSDKDIYLYTIIPDFFKKSGFQVTEKPEKVPAEDPKICRQCDPSRCVCMVKPK